MKQLILKLVKLAKLNKMIEIVKLAKLVKMTELAKLAKLIQMLKIVRILKIMEIMLILLLQCQWLVLNNLLSKLVPMSNLILIMVETIEIKMKTKQKIILNQLMEI